MGRPPAFRRTFWLAGWNAEPQETVWRHPFVTVVVGRWSFVVGPSPTND